MLDVAVQNVVSLGVEVGAAMAAASARPAEVLGLARAPGTIAVDVDLAVLAAWPGADFDGSDFGGTDSAGIDGDGVG